MAAPKVEQTDNNTNINNEDEKAKEMEETKQNIFIPASKKETIDKLSKDLQELYQYKAKYVINDNGSVTFYPTPNCKPSDKTLDAQKINMDSILEQLNCTAALTYSDTDTPIIQQENKTCSFIISSLLAWSEHYPFKFKPEHIWLLILQSAAIHVDKNAEQLRSKYVKHEGKITLKVEVSGNPSQNEWQGAIGQFVDQIDKVTVDDTVKLFDCNFSSSTTTEQIAAKVTIMDICKNYVNYMCMTLCGFPQITLDGNKQDWINLKQKVIKLLHTKVTKEFATKWGKALLPLLDRFIVAFDGKIDCVFWNSMIKRGATFGSGAHSYFCGWFNVLFPYLEDEFNRYCTPYSMEQEYVMASDLFGYSSTGYNVDGYPTGLASAPVKWNRLGQMIDLRFIAGFIGFKQHTKTLEICPNIGWCIAKSMSEEQIKQRKKSKWEY